MKLLSASVCLLLFIGVSQEALAAKKKSRHRHHRHSPLAAEPKVPTETPAQDTQPEGTQPEGTQPGDKPSEDKASLDFDFFGDKAGGKGAGKTIDLDVAERERQSQTRRWMLKTHQTLGMTTWALMAATVTVGQLNYNQIYRHGGGSMKWQKPHQILVLATSLAFAATASFAIFAPTPYKKPLHFDTGLVHRIAVIGATLGMVTEGLLGWWSTHQANAGNPNNLGTMVLAHQIVGYTTFGFLTLAGGVWVF